MNLGGQKFQKNWIPHLLPSTDFTLNALHNEKIPFFWLILVADRANGHYRLMATNDGFHFDEIDFLTKIEE